MKSQKQQPLLNTYYGQYLVDRSKVCFRRQVTARYSIATLERLVLGGQRMTRRAAATAVALCGDYRSNSALGRALHDTDRGVRTLAEDGIRALWCRTGGPEERRTLAKLIGLNREQDFSGAVRLATRLIGTMPELAEAWNQRAIAYFSTARWKESITDCRRALELNPYHFGAATGLGQCFLQLGDRPAALVSFRHALALNPGLEGVRAHVVYLQRGLRRHE